MTVCIGYRVTSLGAVLVSDGRVTTPDGTLYSDYEPKYVICGSTICLVAGTIGPAWRKLQENPPKNFDLFRQIIDEEEKSDKEDEGTDWIAYDRRKDRLWIGETRTVSSFVTLGSGADLARGALEALPKALTLAAAEEVAVQAVKIAIKCNVFCGGRVRVVVVPRTGSIVVK